MSRERLDAPLLASLAAVVQRRLLTRRVRRLVALTLLACAGASLYADRSGGPQRPGVAVLAAARDLRPGTPLTAADLDRIVLPPALVPAGTLTAATPVDGRLTAGPVRRGEPLTDVRLLGSAQVRAASSAADPVAVPIRVADGGAAALLRAGDVVDVLATTTSERDTGSARVVARAVPVLAVPDGDGGPLAEGALVLVATGRTEARAVAAAAVRDRLSVTVLTR